MTVATEAAYRELVYTGAELTFSPGFSAEDVSHVTLKYLDADDLPQPLTRGTHFSVTLGAANAVTVTAIALPVATVLAPVTLLFERVTPALQAVAFANLNGYDAATHELLHDRAMRVGGELRSKISRLFDPTVTDEFLDFRPRRVKAADPEDDNDLATKFYVDEASGLNAQVAAEAARDIAIANAALTDADRIAAQAARAEAEEFADILGNPDYGFYTDIPTTSRDYGTYI